MTKKPGQPVRGSRTGKPLNTLFDVLGQRWTLRILWELRSGRLNFRQLQTSCDDVSPTVLNTRLKTLRGLNLVDHNEEGYGYTDWGRELARQLSSLHEWSEKWASDLEKIRD